MKISTNESISAIYYALWQGGYEYAALERDEEHMAALAAFKGDTIHPFFAMTRRNTCEVYAFWPRAALLETAVFHMAQEKFRDAEELRRKIMGMPNITDEERGEDLLVWLADFPAALADVLSSFGFRRYRAWVEKWVQAQNVHHANELAQIERCLTVCRERYASPLNMVQLLIDPIKCVYSADYHVNGSTFVFSSGRFCAESVIHEYLHHVVHPVVVRYADRIPLREYPGLDASYHAAGPLYAFEEHAVRLLTKLAIEGKLPPDLDAYVQKLLP